MTFYLASDYKEKLYVDNLYLDKANKDVLLSRIAANIIGLAAGDSLALDTLLLDRANRDVSMSRRDANKLTLAAGDHLEVDEIYLDRDNRDIRLYRNAADKLALATGDTLLLEAIDELTAGGYVTISGSKLGEDLDPDAYGGIKVAYQFLRTNVAADLTDDPMLVNDTSGPNAHYPPYAGSVLAVAIRSNAARTAGTCAVEVMVNGTGTGLIATLDGTNTVGHAVAQAKDTDTFSVGASVNAHLTTSSDWAPTTADIVVVVIVEM